MERSTADQMALTASRDENAREEFLAAEKTHILKLTGTILKHSVTESDDEFSIALSAVNQALNSYSLDKGHFWSYAGIVIKSRVYDYYRSSASPGREIPVRPEAFDGDVEDEDPDFSLQEEVRDQASVVVDTSLRDEILAISEELSDYGISFFDLAENSPKAEKTRKSCAELIRAMFAPPPPLTGKLKKSHTLPIKELLLRAGVSRKIVDRYRKYVITSTLILAGDYPGLSEYLRSVRESIPDDNRN